MTTAEKARQYFDSIELPKTLQLNKHTRIDDLKLCIDTAIERNNIELLREIANKINETK